MPKIQYRTKKFHGKTLKVIATANAILEELAAQGYEITLRQLYYQLVSKALISNNEKEYKKLGQTVNDARLAGLIDWNHIQDRGRWLRSLSHWNSPADIINSAAHSFRTDMWANQKVRIECWVEKDALVGVVGRACEELDIPYFSCKGYTSQSEMWGCAQRMESYMAAGKQPVVLHLGDHDPSGLDMTRDVDDRLTMFLKAKAHSIKRLALNIDQVKQYNPPPNPAKQTDSRCENYVMEFGNESWELDALAPPVISALISNAARGFINQRQWAKDAKAAATQRTLLTRVAKEWSAVAQAFTDM